MCSIHQSIFLFYFSFYQAVSSWRFFQYELTRWNIADSVPLVHDISSQDSLVNDSIQRHVVVWSYLPIKVKTKHKIQVKYNKSSGSFMPELNPVSIGWHNLNHIAKYPPCTLPWQFASTHSSPVHYSPAGVVTGVSLRSKHEPVPILVRHPLTYHVSPFLPSPSQPLTPWNKNHLTLSKL